MQPEPTSLTSSTEAGNTTSESSTSSVCKAHTTLQENCSPQLFERRAIESQVTRPRYLPFSSSSPNIWKFLKESLQKEVSRNLSCSIHHIHICNSENVKCQVVCFPSPPHPPPPLTLSYSKRLVELEKEKKQKTKKEKRPVSKNAISGNHCILF